jgi:hypothetical protein
MFRPTSPVQTSQNTQYGGYQWDISVAVGMPGDPMVSIPAALINSIVVESSIDSSVITAQLYIDNQRNSFLEPFRLTGAEWWYIKVTVGSLFKRQFEQKYGRMKLDDVTFECAFATDCFNIPTMSGGTNSNDPIVVTLYDLTSHLLYNSETVRDYVPTGDNLSVWLKRYLETAILDNGGTVSKYVDSSIVGSWAAADTMFDFPKQVYSDSKMTALEKLTRCLYSTDGDHTYRVIRDNLGRYNLVTNSSMSKQDPKFLTFRSDSANAMADNTNTKNVDGCVVIGITAEEVNENINDRMVVSFDPMTKSMGTTEVVVKELVSDGKVKIGSGVSMLHPNRYGENSAFVYQSPHKNGKALTAVDKNTMSRCLTTRLWSIDIITSAGQFDIFCGKRYLIGNPSCLDKTAGFESSLSGDYICAKAKRIWSREGYQTTATMVKNTFFGSIDKNRHGGYIL